MAVTIKETYTLPSKGLIYGIEGFNPKITLRSMTAVEEMKRLSTNVDEYQLMSEIIEDCIEGEKPPISVYDMCIGDYEFLLHKLRIVTQGPIYKMVIQCPNCGNIVQSDVDLDKEVVVEFNQEEIDKAMEITLPVTQKKVTLTFQTPRSLDKIKEQANDMRMKKKTNLKYELLFTTMSFIRSVDGKSMDPLMLEEFVKKLPKRDADYIIKKGDELNRKVGFERTVIAKCNQCNYETVTSFRLQPDFFGSYDD